MSESMRERPPCSIKDGCGKSRVCSEGVLTKTQNRLISSATANYAPFCETSCRSSKPARSSSELRDAMPSVNSPGFAKRPVSNGLPVSVMKGTCKTPFSGSSNLKGLKGWNVVAGPARGVYNSVSDAFPQESAQSYRDSQPAPVTKTPHPISTAERALLVGVGWKRAPRFPGMPAGEPGRESLSELVELARSAGAEVAGTVFQLREAADRRVIDRTQLILDIFDVSLLYGRKVAVENDERRFVRRSFRADFVQFPAADKRGGIGGLSQLKDGSRNFRAGTTRQFNQFGKGLAARLARGHAGKARRTLPPHAHKQGALRSRDGMRCFRHGSRLGVTIRLCAFLGECIRNRIIHSSCGPRDYVPPLETLEIRGTGKWRLASPLHHRNRQTIRHRPLCETR